MLPFWPWPSALGILRLLLAVLSLNHLILRVLEALTNHTIDDVNGDSATGMKVAYVPDSGNVWKNQDKCGDCAIVPDTTVRVLYRPMAAVSDLVGFSFVRTRLTIRGPA